MAVVSLQEPTPTGPAEAPRSSSRRRLSRQWRRPVTRWMVVAGLLVLAAVSLVLRSRALSFHYWVDEGISVGIASHPLSRLPSLLRQDGSPPLYYALLHVWIGAWGSGEVATHWLSLIFALVTIPVAYWAGASLLGRRVGAYCAVLAAGVPFLTSYGQETRMYSLLVLLSLLVAASFAHAFVLRRRRYLPLFVVSLAAALYTHNWALFLGLVTFATYLACVVRSADRRALARDGALGFGLVALLYLPWLPTLLYQVRHTGAPWALPPIVWSVPQGAYFIVGGRGAAVALLLAAGSGLLAVRAAARRQDAAAPERAAGRTAAVLLAIGLGTLLVAWVYAKISPAWSFRYLAVIVGPLLLAVGLGLARASRLGVAALALVCCFWVLDPLPTSRDAKSNVASVAHAVGARTGADALVLSTQPEQVPTLAHYLPRVKNFATPLGRVPDPGVVDWRNALERFRRSSVATVLAPLLHRVTPGERVDLVLPLRIQKAPEWMVLIRRADASWSRYLARDRHLRLVAQSRGGDAPSGTPVEILVYVATGR